MTAFTVSENSDFGILRLIVSDTDKALDVLRNSKYAVTEADVVCLHCPNQPGALAKAMTIITQAGIFIEYMYAFSLGERAVVVLRTDNRPKAFEIIERNHFTLISEDEIKKL